LFDIISILDAKLVSNEVAREIFQQFDAQIWESRKATLQKQWDIFFRDQLPRNPDFQKYMGAYESYLKRFKSIP
jgi:hypothetical protein